MPIFTGPAPFSQTIQSLLAKELALKDRHKRNRSTGFFRLKSSRRMASF